MVILKVSLVLKQNKYDTITDHFSCSLVAENAEFLMLGYLALTGDISWAHPARSIVPLSAQMICRRGVVADWQIGKISTWLLLLVLLGVSLGPGYSPKFLSMSLTLQLRTVAIKPMFFGCMRGEAKQEGLVQCKVRFSLLSIPPNLTLKFDYKKTSFLYCLMKASWFQIPQIHSRPVWWVHASKTHKFKASCARTTVHNNPFLLATHNLWWSMSERKLKSTDEGICTKVAVIGFTWLPFPSVAWPPLAWFLQYASKILSEASFFPLHIHMCKPILLL